MSSLNGILRRRAATHANAHLADVSAAINAHSEDGLPGYEFFYDNVHFNFNGNYLAAATMFDSLRELLMDTGLVEVEGDVAPPAKPDCAERLAWTPAAEYELLGWQMQVFQDPHTGARTRERHTQLFEQLGEHWRAQLSDDFDAALAYNPDDLYLRHAWFRLLLELGRNDEAHAQSVALLERHPAARVSLRAAGQIAEATGDIQDAIRAYGACLDLYPDDPEALRRLAELLFQQGDFNRASSLYHRFLRMDPTDAFAWCRIGEIHGK
ncbi:MAG TPA: tetratricopeptide repeat protein, partial [Candidatus Hydrogenedentes bacterium]|nr:tetratricopeptide repeat protein [Candidatus Hydrogenedentota bacterium]